MEVWSIVVIIIKENNDNTESTKKSTRGKSWGGRDKGSCVVTDPHTLFSQCYHIVESCCVLLLIGILTGLCALPYDLL